MKVSQVALLEAPGVEIGVAVTTNVGLGVRRRVLPRPGQVPRPRLSPLWGASTHVLLRKQLSPRPCRRLPGLRLPIEEPTVLQTLEGRTCIVLTKG